MADILGDFTERRQNLLILHVPVIGLFLITMRAPEIASTAVGKNFDDRYMRAEGDILPS